jgi:predicted RNase H-like HicB family nuclease
MDYLAYLHKDRNSDFGVSFPDFPGCITAGRTLEEAQRMAVEALALHIAGIVEDGQTIPEPSTLDALAEDPAMKHAVAFLVHVEPEAETERTVRINITARAKQVELIDQLAGQAGMTRSAYMVQSSLNRFPRQARAGAASKPAGRKARTQPVRTAAGKAPGKVPYTRRAGPGGPARTRGSAPQAERSIPKPDTFKSPTPFP